MCNINDMQQYAVGELTIFYASLVKNKARLVLYMKERFIINQ